MKPEVTANADPWREQLVETRRSQILEAAVQVFAEKGFHRATVKEIASTAGIAEGTIYNYFGSKRELLIAMIDKFALESVKQILSDEAYSDPKDLIRAILKDRLDMLRERHSIFMAVFPEVLLSDELRKLLFGEMIFPIMDKSRNAVKQGVEAGRFREVNPVIFTRMVMGAMMSYMFLSLSDEINTYKGMSNDEIVDTWLDIFFYGLLKRDDEEAGDAA
jgi:AcrR family transcriptional regulator